MLSIFAVPHKLILPQIMPLMRIIRSESHHCILLSQPEAQCLLDVCAMVLLAGQDNPRATLPSPMNDLLIILFDQLRKPASEEDGVEPFASSASP
jgi:hypothetical protein